MVVVDSWSAAELGVELGRIGCDLRAAEALEGASERRHAAGSDAEAEEALPGRREEEAESVRQRRALLLDELGCREGVRRR